MARHGGLVLVAALVMAGGCAGAPQSRIGPAELIGSAVLTAEQAESLLTICRRGAGAPGRNHGCNSLAARVPRDPEPCGAATELCLTWSRGRNPAEVRLEDRRPGSPLCGPGVALCAGVTVADRTIVALY